MARIPVDPTYILFHTSLFVGFGDMANRRRHIADRMAERRSQAPDGFVRETFALPRLEARDRAKAFLRNYPKAAYMSEVEHWHVLPGDTIEFTMRRLPTAD